MLDTAVERKDKEQWLYNQNSIFKSSTLKSIFLQWGKEKAKKLVYQTTKWNMQYKKTTQKWLNSTLSNITEQVLSEVWEAENGSTNQFATYVNKAVCPETLKYLNI